MSASDKIRSFANLPKGWTFKNAEAPGALTIDLALKIERLLRDSGYPETNAFPGGDNNIEVVGYRDGCSVSIEVRDDGRYKPSEIPTPAGSPAPQENLKPWTS